MKVWLDTQTLPAGLRKAHERSLRNSNGKQKAGSKYAQCQASDGMRSSQINPKKW